MKKKIKSLKTKIFALLGVALILIASAIPCFADDVSSDTLERGRIVTSIYNVTTGDDDDNDDIQELYNFTGMSVNGNNLYGPNIYNSAYYEGVSYYFDHGSYFDYGFYGFNDEANTYPADEYVLQIMTDANVGQNDTMSFTFNDIYLWIEATPEGYVYDDIDVQFSQVARDFVLPPVSWSANVSYYDLLADDFGPSSEPITENFEYIIGDWDDTERTNEFSFLEFVPDIEGGQHLFYFEYITFTYDMDDIDYPVTSIVNIEYCLLPTIEFDFNDEHYTLTTQTDFDNFRLGLYSSSDDVGYDVTIPSEFIRPYANWIASAVGGFFSIQLFPGFYFGGLIVTIIAFALVMWWLKMFGGG